MSSGASTAASGPERDAGSAGADVPGDANRTDDATTTARAEASPPHTGSHAPDPAPRDRARTSDTHAQFLITSDERDAAEARLRQAVADEALSLEEFGDRMRLLLAATTRGDLQAAVAGLGAARESATRADQRGHVRPARAQSSVVGILGRSTTSGRWRPGHSTTAVAVLGEATVDLQGAEYEGDELVINAFSVLGEVEIVVPEGVEVDLRGIAVLGERNDRTDRVVVPGTPVVRVDGLALLGEITVRHPRKAERYISPDGRGPFADRLPAATAQQRAAGAARRRARRRWAAARSWGAGLLVAAVLALPFGWTLAADDVAAAVFGSAQQTVSAAALEGRESLSVGTPVAFGSVEVQVPEGVNVELDGVVIFGSMACDPGCAADIADAPTVQIRGFGGFGSVEVTRITAAGTS